jgi:hypothetical protein
MLGRHRAFVYYWASPGAFSICPCVVEAIHLRSFSGASWHLDTAASRIGRSLHRIDHRQPRDGVRPMPAARESPTSLHQCARRRRMGPAMTPASSSVPGQAAREDQRHFFWAEPVQNENGGAARHRRCRTLDQGTRDDTIVIAHFLVIARSFKSSDRATAISSLLHRRQAARCRRTYNFLPVDSGIKNTLDRSWSRDMSSRAAMSLFIYYEREKRLCSARRRPHSKLRA